MCHSVTLSDTDQDDATQRSSSPSQIWLTMGRLCHRLRMEKEDLLTVNWATWWGIPLVLGSKGKGERDMVKPPWRQASIDFPPIIRLCHHLNDRFHVSSNPFFFVGIPLCNSLSQWRSNHGRRPTLPFLLKLHNLIQWWRKSPNALIHTLWLIFKEVFSSLSLDNWLKIGSTLHSSCQFNCENHNSSNIIWEGI